MVTLIDWTEGKGPQSPLTLGVLQAEDGSVNGRIVASGLPSMGSTFPNDPPIERAISMVNEIARRHGVQHVLVVDESRLWRPAWGELVKAL